MTDSLYGQKVLIDTEAERSALEYRPNVKYEKKVEFDVNFPVQASTEAPPNEENEDGSYTPVTKPAEQYVEFGEHAQDLKDMLAYVVEEIKEMKVPLTPKDIVRIQETSPMLGAELMKDGVIDFAAYEATFEDPNNPVNSLIQDIVTAYAEDVDGNLQLEFYEDLKEMELTLREGFFLYKETILKHYLEGELPAAPTNDEDFAKRLDEAVKAKREQFDETKKAYGLKEADYYESLRTEYGTPEFFRKTDEYNKKKRPYDLALREQKTLNEMGGLVDGLLDGTDDCVSTIKSRLVLGSELDKEEVMKVLENQATSTEQLTGLLKLTQLSLKLQLNQQIQEKKQYRDVLKNINNLSRKERAHDEMLMAYELRNKMYLTMYDTLEHLQSPSKKSGVEAFLNNVAGGMTLVQQEFESFLKDIYLMYASEYEVRKEKIDKTLEKENARAGYSLVLDYL